MASKATSLFSPWLPEAVCLAFTYFKMHKIFRMQLFKMWRIVIHLSYVDSSGTQFSSFLYSPVGLLD